MSPAQIAVVALGGLVGVGLIVYGVSAWLRNRTGSKPSRKNFHLPPAAIVFGVSFLLFSANTAIVIVSDHRSSLQWWFLASESGPIAGFFSPAMVCFLLGFFVLAWWPRDRGSAQRVISGFKSPRTRPRLLWEAGRLIATVVVGVLVMLGWFALTVCASRFEGFAALSGVGGVLTIPALVGGGLLGYWAYGRVLHRPETLPFSEDPRVSQPPERPTE